MPNQVLMAHLMAIALETHPSMGACFVMRFSWNSRLENPVARLKTIPAREREYDQDGRRWWVAAAHVELLAQLFDNWMEEIMVLARSQPDIFSRVMTQVMRERILAAASGTLAAAPALSYDDLMQALGGVVGWWLHEWQQTAPTAAAVITPQRQRDVNALAASLRRELPTWALRAAVVSALLMDEPVSTPTDSSD